MRKLQVLCCFVLLSVLLCSSAWGQLQNPEIRQGVIRIKIKSELAEVLNSTSKTRSGVVRTGLATLDDVNRKVRAIRMTRVFPYAPKFEEKMKKHGLHLWYEIRYDNSLTPEQTVSLYQALPDVQIAESIRKPGVGNPKFIPFSLPQTRAQDAPFNDPRLSEQWHYRNDGTVTEAVIGADINLYEAWKITTGKPNVVVAIIDEGVDYKHKDLAANIWANQAELNGTPGVDDDGNGYIDDVYGFNFVSNNGDLYPQNHGTHVAGTVAAVNNNGVGVAGVAGGSGKGDGIRMMLCQVFDDRSNKDGDFAAPLVYAANNGAVIAQCSWGWNTPGYKEQAVLDAIDYFVQEAGDYPNSPMTGGICIFAAGNVGTEGDYYPAAHPSAFSVGAMGVDMKVTSYSNYGTWVDVTAPGGVVEFTAATGVLSTMPNDQYGAMQGTSMACPHVSGIAALVLSQYGNKDFTPDMLIRRLSTAVHDLYKVNPDYAGKCGSGYIDAAMALSENTGKAPETINEYTLYPSQQEITIEWVIPNDADDKIVDKHIIYWSEKEFSATSNLSSLSQKEIVTRFKQTGENMNIELSGYKPETQYWFAIQAVDRWNNRSTLSPVRITKTNSGPKVIFSKTKLSLSLNASLADNTETSLNLKNEGEGLLKWSANLRTQKIHSPAAKSIQVVRNIPAEISTGKQSGKMSEEKVTPVAIAFADYIKEDYPKSFAYSKVTDFYLGESDSTKSNSIAQYFYIDGSMYPNGFNLTHIQVDGKKKKGRPILQIYEGDGKLIPESLIYSDTLAESATFFNTNVALKEQFFFAPETSFYIVIHISRENKNPFGAGTELQAHYSQCSFYSSNRGKTWTLLKDILKASGGILAEEAELQTWNLKAISQNPAWDQLMTLTPASGKVGYNESADVKLSTNGKGMINGTYYFNLHFITNETGKETTTVPTTLTISGNKPALHSAKVIDFGRVFVGESKGIKIEIMNSGYGPFAGKFGSLQSSDITVSNKTDFTIPTYISALGARSTSYITATYNPKTPGTHFSTVTLKDQNGITHTFQTTGVAINPATINIDPAQINAGDLALDNTSSVNFTIKNTGGFPLEYVMPRFSKDTIAGLKKTSHQYGYSYISNLNGSTDFPYEWKPLLNATEIKAQLEENYWSQPINIGFDFPFYNEKYDKIYIGSYGALSMTGEGFMHSCFPPSADKSCIRDLGLITAFGGGNLQFDGKSKLLYGKQDGKFVVSYENVLAQKDAGEGFEYITFRIALCVNGDIEIYYRNYNSDVLFQPENLYIGCADIPVDDPFTITDKTTSKNSSLYQDIKDGSAIKIVAPDRNMITSINKPSGIIGIGQQETITLEITADTSMYLGPIKNILAILSNDPNKSTANIIIEGNVTGDYYKPVAILNKSALNLGDVFQTAHVSDIITISNKGKATLAVNKVEATLFTPEYPAFTIEAGQSVDIIVTAPSVNKGQVADQLEINTSDKNFTVQLSANIINAPGIEISPASLNQTLESGSTKGVEYNFTNTGENTLEYTIQPNGIFYPTDFTVSTGEDIDYNANSSIDSKDVIFDWIDITASGVHKNSKYFAEHDFVEVDMPYGFTFYGKEYRKMYICMSGFITFNEYEDQNNLPPPVDKIPSTEHYYKNFIAPYWGNHTPADTKISGVYYEFQSDKIVVSFIDYNNTLNMGVCYQALLYKDGKIKYQFRLMEGYGTYFGSFGISGLENNEGTKGIKMSDRYISMNSAIELLPVKKHTVAPGKTKKVDMTINTNGLMADDYPISLPLTTNVPSKENMTMDLDLTVTGKAKPAYPAILDLGDIMIGDPDMTYEFTIGNSGTAFFNITDIQYGSSDFMLVYWGIDSWTGNEAWVPYLGESFKIGKNGQRFAIYVPSPYQATEVNDVLTVTTDSPERTIEIPVRLNITDLPEMKVAQKDYKLYAPSEEFKHDSTFILENSGLHPLTYKVDIKYASDPASDNEDEGTWALPIKQASAPLPTTALQPISKATNQSISTRADNNDYPVDEEYTRTLTYPWGKGIGTMGTAEKYESFIGSTKFKAPADGFNIAAIQYVGTIGELASGTVRAEIRNGGASHLESKVIGSGEITITGPEMNSDGKVKNSLRTIVFDSPVYINPSETFYLYLHFPAGTPHVLAIAEAAEAGITDRYWSKMPTSGWSDLAELEKQYGPVGFMTRCLEKSAGKIWLTLEEAQQGKVDAESKKELTLKIDASAARHAKGNRATVTITGNDPVSPLHSFKVTLDKNSGPVITTPENAISVKENAHHYVDFTIVDNESDHFTFKIADSTGIAKAVPDSTRVMLSPLYGHTGNRSFNIVATDEYGYTSTKTVNYYVEKVNQNPIVISPVSHITAKQGDPIDGIDLSQVFSDPDHDELNYTVSSDNENVVKAAVSGNLTEFVVKGTGEAEVILTATDPGTLFATTSFKVTIIEPQKDLTKKQIIAYPNPVVYQLSIRCSADVRGESIIRLYGTDGNLFYTEKTVIEPGVIKTVDMTNYPAGIYILEIESRDEKLSTKVIKQ